jgi:nucleoside-diphosphate-sugar epimerase
MKVLIIGGAGYIGSRLVPELVGIGHEITIVDKLWFGNYLPATVKIIQQDSLSLKEDFMRGFDAVIFLSGLSNDPMAEFSPSLNFVANASAPVHAAYLAKQAGVKKFIYADSCSVYGFTGGEEIDENYIPKSTYPYGVSKMLGGLGVLQFMDSNFSTICLRQGTVSGFSPRMRFDLFVNTMYMKAMTEGKIVVNNTAIWRPLLAISDAVNAYVKALEAPFGISGIFNVSSGNLQIGGAAERINDYFKRVRGVNLQLEINNVVDMRNYRVSNKKAQEVLGVKFKGSIESILDELNEHFGNHFDFGHDNFYNIKVFKKLFKE